MGDLGRDYYASAAGSADKVFTFGYFPAIAKHAAAPPVLSELAADNRFVILVAASLVPRKGIDLALQAIARLDASDVPARPLLLIAGTGEDEARLKTMAADLEIAENVHWLGVVNYEALTAMMQPVDLVVVPSRHDGWGTVPNEALQAGCPIVVTNTCGSACLVIDSDLGRVVTPDPGTIAAACQEALSLGKLSAHRRSAIRKWASRSISPDAAANYVIEILSLPGNASRCKPTPPWLPSSTHRDTASRSAAL